jgi:CheY-like chemotaxis protein
MARILIVDDTEMVRAVLERVVRRMGHTVVTAGDPRTACQMAFADPPDLALVDLQLPGMGGAELFEEMRAALGERCPRVLFVSGMPSEDVARELRRFGQPPAYLPKPCHLDDLVRSVAAALTAPAEGRARLAGAGA